MVHRTVMGYGKRKSHENHAVVIIIITIIIVIDAVFGAIVASVLKYWKEIVAQRVRSVVLKVMLRYVCIINENQNIVGTFHQSLHQLEVHAAKTKAVIVNAFIEVHDANVKANALKINPNQCQEKSQMKKTMSFKKFQQMIKT